RSTGGAVMRLIKDLQPVGADQPTRRQLDNTKHKEHLMYRFLSWMAIGIAAAFLVVATAAFSLPVVKSLAFAIGFGTLIVSGSIGFSYRSAGCRGSPGGGFRRVRAEARGEQVEVGDDPHTCDVVLTSHDGLPGCMPSATV